MRREGSRRRLTASAAAFVLVAVLLPAVPAASASTGTAVFINEIHYDNVSTDSGEAIEVAGPAGTDLTGWSLVLYNGNGGVAYDTASLTGTIPDQDDGYGTAYVSYPSNGIQNGSPDGIALVDASSSVVQFLSYEGSFAAVGGPADGMTSTDIGVAEGSTTPVGDSLQLTGAGTIYEDFTWTGPLANTFGSVNTGQDFGIVTNAAVMANCGTVDTVEGYAGSADVSASDADGTVVDLAITSTAVPGITLTDVTAATTVGGTATASLEVAATVAPGTYSVEITATNDDTPTAQTGTCTASVTVEEILPIGTVQGSVGDTDDGATFDSTYVGQYVVVQGVIYEKIISRTSSGSSTYGFFIQNTAATADGDVDSSDGIFVYMSYYDDLIGGYVPRVGDEVVLRGRVSEYYHLTELSSARAVDVLRSDVDVDAEVAPFEANPPSVLADAERYWERHEGMRAEVPAGSLVLNGRDVFASTLDGEVWVMRGDSQLAARTDPFARRSFRDPHPLDDLSALFDNGNGYRIVMGSLGLKGAAEENTALIAPARAFDTLDAAVDGGVYFSYAKYQIQVTEQLSLTAGIDPSTNAPVPGFDRDANFSLATFNVENLYDYRDDLFDGCDFAGNSGCEGVYPPFDYVPASDAAYQTRLGEIASQIITDLHSPDVVMVQEVEDQDICTVSDGSLSCGTTNNADGKPDTVQELATVIASQGGPAYDAAYDRDGADDRGIVSAFLYRTDRVQLLPAAAADPVLGSSPTVGYRGTALDSNADVQNPKTLNAVLPADVDTSTGVDGNNVFTRAPQVGLFRVWRTGIGESVFTDVYLVDNHFSSGPDGRVGQRTEQALYNAAIVAALQAADPGAAVVVGGDLNVYPRPDDPFPPPNESDQLAALYEQGMTNLYDSLVAATGVPAAAYSYIYEGQAQTLDQLFVTPSVLADLVQMRAAHINSDFPSDYTGDGARGTSDHDPQVAQETLLPTLDRLHDLVDYFVGTEAIGGKKTADILHGMLDRAGAYQEAGLDAAYQAQLLAFVNQVEGFAPKWVDQSAADTISEETDMLANA